MEDGSKHQLELELATFFKENPESNYDGDASSGSIIHPWGDDTVELAISSTNDSLVGTLNSVYLPPHFTAILHLDSQDLEIIWGPVPGDDEIRARTFTFELDDKQYVCEFGDVSERLMHIADASRFVKPPSVTSHRNLQTFEFYLHMKRERPESRIATSMTPTSFWIRNIKWDDENRMTELARHLNFFMHYFDKRTPLIEIHEPPSSEQGS